MRKVKHTEMQTHIHICAFLVGVPVSRRLDAQNSKTEVIMNWVYPDDQDLSNKKIRDCSVCLYVYGVTGMEKRSVG